jgi:hypothetical protein
MPHPADTGVSRTERRIMLLERHVSALRQNSRLRRSLDIEVEYATWLNEAFTTTPTTFATVTLTRPEWAARALVTATLGLQMSNTSGGGQNAIGQVEIPGEPIAQLEMTVADATTDAFSVPMAWNLTGLTDNVTVRGNAKVSVGTNAGNYAHLVVQAVWQP